MLRIKAATSQRCEMAAFILKGLFLYDINNFFRTGHNIVGIKIL